MTSTICDQTMWQKSGLKLEKYLELHISRAIVNWPWNISLLAVYSLMYISHASEQQQATSTESTVQCNRLAKLTDGLLSPAPPTTAHLLSTMSASCFINCDTATLNLGFDVDNVLMTNSDANSSVDFYNESHFLRLFKTATFANLPHYH